MAPQPCTWCNQLPATSSSSEQTAFKVCDACKLVCYCSRECQKSDWKYHELICKQYGEFMSSTPRPSQLHKLALIFPTDTEKPEFRWVEFQYEDAGPESWENPIHEPHLGPADADGETYFKRYDISSRLHRQFPAKHKYDLDHTVAVYVREDWGHDGSKLNGSIDKMMKGSQPIKWSGPMLAFSLPGIGDDPPFFRDFSLADIRVVADFLDLFGGPSWNDTGSGFIALSGDALRHFSNFGANWGV